MIKNNSDYFCNWLVALTMPQSLIQLQKEQRFNTVKTKCLQQDYTIVSLSYLLECLLTGLM